MLRTLLRGALALALVSSVAHAGQITTDVNTVFRDYVVDGVPSSGAWNPKKSEIRTWGALIDTETAKADRLTSGQIPSLARLPSIPDATVLCNVSGGSAAPTACATLPSGLTIPSPTITLTASGTGAVSQTLNQILSNIVLADNYGAVGDGTTDDKTAILNAANSLGANGGEVLLSCSKNYRIGTSLIVPVNVTIKHCRGSGGNPGVDWTTGPIASQPHVRLDSAAIITLSSNSGFEGVILRTGMTIPVQTPAVYAGTAVALPAGGANDTKLRALIVGFATCVDGTNGGDRYDWDIECDGNPSATSGSVIIGPSADSSMARVRTYPWGTVAYSPSPTLTRSGYGTQILTGVQDDSRLDIMDYGHSKGLVSAANGNIHFTHIWTDNNTSYGIQFDAGDRVHIDAAWVYSSLGARFNANGVYSFGYLLSDTGAVAAAEGVETAAGVAPQIQIGKWDVKKTASYALNVGSTTALVSVGSASFENVNGGVGPYIVGPSGWRSDQIYVGSIKTGLADGSSLFGGNTVTIKQVASASTMALPVTGSVFSVTGTTAINTISGTWGGREITLLFESTASLTTAGNITLFNSVTMQGAAGITVDLLYDQVSGKWREKGRNLGTASTENMGTSGHTVPFNDGDNTFSGNQSTTGTFALNNAAPLRFYGPSAGVDNKLWDTYSDNTASNSLHFRAVNDAVSAGTDWMTVDRSGATATLVTLAPQLKLSSTPIFSTLTGYLKGNGAGALTAAATIPSADLADGNSGTGNFVHTSGAVENPSRLKLTDQGQCTMAAGACAAQSLGSTYATAPLCVLTWTGTGALAGHLKVASTTTTVTPTSDNAADTAQVNWSCFGN